MTQGHVASLLLATTMLAGVAAGEAGAVDTLSGFAVLPADTFAPGPISGNFQVTANRPTPYDGQTIAVLNGQPIQGFSGVQFVPGTTNQYWFLSDNGFGSKTNSPDYVLRLYNAQPDFRTTAGGTGTVPVPTTFVQLADPNNLIGFPIVADSAFYPSSAIPVDAQIRANRWLTGGDLDVESVVIDSTGNFWIGDEFGPFVAKFDSSGVLQAAPVPTPNVDLSTGSFIAGEFVRSPQNPFDAASPNLGGSRGFEGMAFSPDRQTLYPLLEGTVTGDPAGSLRIYEFDVATGAFSGFAGLYQMASTSNAIGDFTPINDTEFLIIERDGGQGAGAAFKKIFKIDISNITGGFVEKTEIVDLLNIADPNDLDGDGSNIFTFPFVTIEDVLVIDSKTILVANDNNYPGSIGRIYPEVPGIGIGVDNNEIIIITLDETLNLDPRLGAIPAPATALALAFGLAVLAGVRRR